MLRELLDLVVGEAAGRLVEQDEARPHGQAAGDLQEALLGMVEQVGAPAAGRGRGPTPCSSSPRAARSARSSRPTAGRPSAVARKPRRACGQRAEHGVVEHAAASPSRRGFWKVRAMPSSRAPLHRRGDRSSSSSADLAAGRLVVAGQEIEQRRLAAAVRADEAVHLARAQLQRDTIERHQAAELLVMSFAVDRVAAAAPDRAAGDRRACEHAGRDRQRDRFALMTRCS